MINVASKVHTFFVHLMDLAKPESPQDTASDLRMIAMHMHQSADRLYQVADALDQVADALDQVDDEQLELIIDDHFTAHGKEVR